jgi:SnoaL-like domain
VPDERAAELETLVRRIWDRWNAGERDPTAMGPGVTDDFVLESAMTGRTFRGRDGLVEWMTEIDENFGAWRLWIDEVRPRGADCLLILGGVHLRGRGSGWNSISRSGGSWSGRETY